MDQFITFYILRSRSNLAPNSEDLAEGEKDFVNEDDE